MIDFKRHSPSSLNLFAASPALFVLEKVLGVRQPGNAPMFRGTAVEDGVTHGLMNPSASLEECAEVAHKKYEIISALSLDKRREDFRKDVKGMVESALVELRPYGVPSHCQQFVEWRPEGLRYPIVGYLDYHWADHNVTVDLKTSEKLPSSVKVPHARQISLYVTSNNADARISYISPKKHATYQVENIDAHRSALHQMAIRCESFLALGDTPEFFKSITLPDLESFYWTSPPTRQLAFEHWGV